MFGKLRRILGIKKTQEEATTATALPAAPRTQQSDSLGENEREAMLMIACGQKGIGKTYTSLKEMKAYTETHNRPVVIFDTNQEYTQIKEIRLKDLKNLKKAEIRRVLPLKEVNVKFVKGKEIIETEQMTEVEQQQTAKKILKICRNMLVVLEDFNSYSQNSRDAGITTLIVNNRQRSQDIIFHVQSISRIDTIMFQNTAILRLHRQFDELERYLKRVNYPEMTYLGYLYLELVYDQIDKRSYIYIDFLSGALRGIKHMEMFEEACKHYLALKPKVLKDLKATTKIKDNDEAIEHYIKQKKRQYIYEQKNIANQKTLKEKN